MRIHDSIILFNLQHCPHSHFDIQKSQHLHIVDGRLILAFIMSSNNICRLHLSLVFAYCFMSLLVCTCNGVCMHKATACCPFLPLRPTSCTYPSTVFAGEKCNTWLILGQSSPIPKASVQKTILVTLSAAIKCVMTISFS